MEETASIIDWLKEAGLVGLLVGFIVALYRQHIVWGWQYRELREENAKLRELLTRNTVIMSKSVEIAEKHRP